MQSGRRDSVPVRAIQQVLCRLSGQNECHHAFESQAGEIMQVDWAGDTAAVIDTDTGEIIPTYVFVAMLPFSGYSYVEGFFSMSRNLGLLPMSMPTNTLVVSPGSSSATT